MAIRFFCPLGHRLKVPDERAGKKGRCPVCHQRLIVPDVSVPQPEPSSLAAPASELKMESMVHSCDDGSDSPVEEPFVASVAAVEPAGFRASAETLPILTPDEVQQAMPSPDAAFVETPSVMVTTVVETLPTRLDEESLVLGVAAAATEAVASQESKGGEAEPGEPMTPAFDVEKISAAELPVVVPVVAATPPPLPPAADSRNGVLPTTTVPREDVRAPARRLQWAAWVRGEAREGFVISRPTPRQVEVVYWLACLLPFAAVFCAAPAVPHMQFAGAPSWAQALLGVACLQAAYAAWLATAPDWSTVRVGMYFFGIIAGLNLLTAIALPFLPDSALAPTGLAGIRGTAAAWCVLSAVVSGTASAACRWIEQRWRTGTL